MSGFNTATDRDTTRACTGGLDGSETLAIRSPRDVHATPSKKEIVALLELRSGSKLYPLLMAAAVLVVADQAVAADPFCRAHSLGRWRITSYEFEKDQSVFSHSLEEARRGVGKTYNVAPSEVKSMGKTCQVISVQHDILEDSEYKYIIQYNCSGKVIIPTLIFSRNCRRVAVEAEGLTWHVERAR
jgi:ribosomal protein S28E/S33